MKFELFDDRKTTDNNKNKNNNNNDNDKRINNINNNNDFLVVDVRLIDAPYHPPTVVVVVMVGKMGKWCAKIPIIITVSPVGVFVIIHEAVGRQVVCVQFHFSSVERL